MPQFSLLQNLVSAGESGKGTGKAAALLFEESPDFSLADLRLMTWCGLFLMDFCRNNKADFLTKTFSYFKPILQNIGNWNLSKKR